MEKVNKGVNVCVKPCKYKKNRKLNCYNPKKSYANKIIKIRAVKKYRYDFDQEEIDLERTIKFLEKYIEEKSSQ